MNLLGHLVVLILLVGIPLVVIAGVVVLVVLLVRASRPAREERIAQRTAELLRQQGGR